MTATAAPLLDCGHPPTYKLGHPYSPDAATVARWKGGDRDVRKCVCDCGQPYTAHGVGSGTATGADGRTYCYPCAGDAEARDFAAADAWLAYDTGKPELTTWTLRASSDDCAASLPPPVAPQ